MEGKKMLKMMVLGIVVVLCAGRAVLASEVVAWGRNDVGQCDVPEPNAGFFAVAGGVLHSLGLKADGSIVAWGLNNFGQCDVSEPNEGFAAVAGGELHSLGLKADGSIAGWGLNNDGQCDVPEPNEGFVAVAGGSYHSLGLKADGSIAAWGRNDYGQCDVPEPNEGFVAVAGGGYHSLGLKADGSIVAWGYNNYGQCNVPEPNEDFIAVAAGYWHSLGLKANGSIVAWGDNAEGQRTVPLPNTGFIAVSAGFYHSLGLKGDGSIVAWGYNSHGQCNVPEPNEDFAAVAGGGSHSLGLKAAEPMGTAITYQGRLIDANSAADGPYDFEFRLYDSGGVQHANTVEANDLDVIDGYFTAELDFGPGVFDGFARWLEIGVRAGELEDPNVYTVLTPRQEVTPTSYALHAKTAESIAAGGYVETDPQVGAISNNNVPKWDGSALVTGTIYDNGNVGIGTIGPAEKLDVAGNVTAAMYYDRNNTGYYLDPDSISLCNDMRAHIFKDQGNTNYYVDPAGTSICSDMRASIFYDRDNTGYYVDPANTGTSANFAGNVYAGNVNGYIFYDRNNSSYYVDPASSGTSAYFAGNVYATRYYDRYETGYYVDPGSFSRLYNVRVWDGSASVDYAGGSGELYVEHDLEVDGPVYMLNAYNTGHGASGRAVRITSDGRLGYGLSSKRYKENIAPLEDDFTKILGAQPVAFVWKKSKEPDIGLIAEDMDELGLRNLVIYDAEGRPESVHYRFVSLYLLEVLKNQASSIKELKAENELLKEQLKTKNQSVKQRLDALEETMQQLAKAKEVQL